MPAQFAARLHDSIKKIAQIEKQKSIFRTNQENRKNSGEQRHDSAKKIDIDPPEQPDPKRRSRGKADSFAQSDGQGHFRIRELQDIDKKHRQSRMHDDQTSPSQHEPNLIFAKGGLLFDQSPRLLPRFNKFRIKRGGLWRRRVYRYQAGRNAIEEKG